MYNRLFTVTSGFKREVPEVSNVLPALVTGLLTKVIEIKIKVDTPFGS